MCLFYIIPPYFKLTLRSRSQSRRGLFKIPTLRRWMVLAAGPELIEDIRKAPDDVLSLLQSAIEVCMLKGMFGSYS